MLVIKEDRILVVDDEAGYTAEVLKGLLMSLAGGLAGEWPVGMACR